MSTVDDLDAPPAPPTLAEELAAAIELRGQAEGVVLLRARALCEALDDLDLPRRHVADALTRLVEGDADLEEAQQRERALRAAMGPTELTEEERIRAETIARADAEDARAA